MKTINIKIAFAAALLVAQCAYAGNPDRAGQAGAPDLLMNPWARSTGMMGLNGAFARGIEAERLNVAGLAYTLNTDIYFGRTQWLRGTDININAVGIGQRISESSVLGLSIMSTSMGNIPLTTTDDPDALLGGTFAPVYTNIGISYAHTFSNSITGGATVRVVNESISNVSARGIALDAGINYVTGEKDRMKFGIALRNVGTPLRYDGDGLAVRTTIEGDNITLTTQQRSADFELPSLMHIGGSYDFFLGEAATLTTAVNFTSNSFTRDRAGVGLELSLREMLELRAGYVIETGGTTQSGSAANGTAYMPFAAGASVNLPLGDTGTKLSLDYSYRPTQVFGGTHAIGLRINLGEKE
jgi:hypothetical protein